MSAVYEYVLGNLTLEFELDGSPSRGHLNVFNTVVGEEQTYGARVDIASSKAMAGYVKEAQALYPEAFPKDDLTLRKAINELGVHVKDDDRARKAKAEEEDEEESVDVNDEDIDELIGVPGVLERIIEDMASVHEVYGDRAEMKVIALSGFSAQLEPPARGKPVGTNAILIGESGRGKNYIADAVASGMPEGFVYEFESASSKSFYYEADAKPDRFRHTWVYANEAEATDQTIETLRPLLSKGAATHKTVDKENDTNVFRELAIEGPITVTIPTVRNKLDWQLQTRLLIVELEEFEGRIAAHSKKVSDTLLPEYAAEDHAQTLNLWKAALGTLTRVRRVVIPKDHSRFHFSSETLSHGARLWRNFLSLMLTNAWLEQRNREIITLENGSEAVVTAAEDYQVAYEAFKGACERSLVNISDTHRRILNALYELQKAEKKSRLREGGYSLRDIANNASVSHETVRQNKAYLSMSLNLIVEFERGGLRLVTGAEPSWWKKGEELLEGFPTPAQVKEWWKVPKVVDTVDSKGKRSEKPIDKPNVLPTEGVDTEVDVSTSGVEEVDVSTRLSTSQLDSKNPIDKPNPDEKGALSTVSTLFESKETNVDFEYSEDE
jgi:hypothetical protein